MWASGIPDCDSHRLQAASAKNHLRVAFSLKRGLIGHSGTQQLFRRLRREDFEFRGSLDNRERLLQKQYRLRMWLSWWSTRLVFVNSGFDLSLPKLRVVSPPSTLGAKWCSNMGLTQMAVATNDMRDPSTWELAVGGSEVQSRPQLRGDCGLTWAT